MNLSGLQVKALIMLSEGDRVIVPNRSPKIVYADDISQTTLWYVKQMDVDALESGGYIVRKGSAANYHYRITDAGRTAASQF